MRSSSQRSSQAGPAKAASQAPSSSPSGPCLTRSARQAGRQAGCLGSRPRAKRRQQPAALPVQPGRALGNITYLPIEKRIETSAMTVFRPPPPLIRAPTDGRIETGIVSGCPAGRGEPKVSDRQRDPSGRFVGRGEKPSVPALAARKDGAFRGPGEGADLVVFSAVFRPAASPDQSPDGRSHRHGTGLRMSGGPGRT